MSDSPREQTDRALAAFLQTHPEYRTTAVLEPRASFAPLDVGGHVATSSHWDSSRVHART